MDLTCDVSGKIVKCAQVLQCNVGTVKNFGYAYRYESRLLKLAFILLIKGCLES